MVMMEIIILLLFCSGPGRSHIQIGTTATVKVSESAFFFLFSFGDKSVGINEMVLKKGKGGGGYIGASFLFLQKTRQAGSSQSGQRKGGVFF